MSTSLLVTTGLSCVCLVMNLVLDVFVMNPGILIKYANDNVSQERRHIKLQMLSQSVYWVAHQTRLLVLTRLLTFLFGCKGCTASLRTGDEHEPW